MAHRAIRWLALAAVPLVIGASLGLTISKALWGYFWTVPTLPTEVAVVPDAISAFWTAPVVAFSESKRDEALQRELALCRKVNRRQNGSDCTVGRVLLATGAERWIGKPLISESEVSELVAWAQARSEIRFFRSNQKGFGVIAEYHSEGRTKRVLAFL